MPWKPARHCTAAKKRTKEGDMSIGEVTSRLASTSQWSPHRRPLQCCDDPAFWSGLVRRRAPPSRHSPAAERSIIGSNSEAVFKEGRTHPRFWSHVYHSTPMGRW